jgi:hypothetical protein
MSVMVLSSDHVDYLTTAAVQASVIAPADAATLATALLRENIDAYLWAYFDGPDVLDGWDDLEDDERDEELAELVTLRDTYTYTPVPAAAIDPARTIQAIETWQYQVNGARHHASGHGWQALQRLTAAIR